MFFFCKKNCIFKRDDVEWSEEQSEQANAIIEKQYEYRMSDTKWGLLII